MQKLEKSKRVQAARARMLHFHGAPGAWRGYQLHAIHAIHEATCPSYSRNTAQNLAWPLRPSSASLLLGGFCSRPLDTHG